MNLIGFKVFMVLSLKCFSHFGHFLFAREKDLCSLRCQRAVFCRGSAVLSALEVYTLMGFIDLNNIRGCGDVIKAEITSV